MPTLGKTLSADAQEFVSGGPCGDADQAASAHLENVAAHTSDDLTSKGQAKTDKPRLTLQRPQTNDGQARSAGQDKKGATASEGPLSKRRGQSRGQAKAHRALLLPPIPLSGPTLQEPRPLQSSVASPMLPNFLPGMPHPYNMEGGYQPAPASMMPGVPGVDVPWLPHAVPYPPGYSMPVSMHTAGPLAMQPLHAAPGGLFPGMAPTHPFWHHSTGPLHPSPGMLPQRYAPGPLPFPMEVAPQWLPYQAAPTAAREGTRLEKFKQCGAYRTWGHKDVRGHVVEFCKDKAGSHFIQSLLEDGSPEQVTSIIGEAKDHILVLMKDAFGNYVVQKMLEKASPAEKHWMLRAICGDRPMPNRVVALSKDHHSCRVIQTALQVFEMKDKIEIMDRLLDGQSALDLVAEQNGNHVIQKCIECVKPASELKPLVQALFSGKMSMPSRSPQGQTIQLRGDIISMCQNVYGCRVVQRLLMYADESTRDVIVEAVLQDVVANAMDTYSNYVIQHILVNGPEDARRFVWAQLGDHIMELSRNKCASNVIEKCLATGGQGEVKKWVDSLCAKHDKLAELMKDQYGNYVCFTAFLKAEEAQRDTFMEVIRWSLHAVRSSTYGKNFLIKLVVSSKTSTYFSADDLGVTPGDIDKFKKMQQTVQSNRNSSKAAGNGAASSRASSSRPADELGELALKGSKKDIDNTANEILAHQSPKATQDPGAVVAERDSDHIKSANRTQECLPPNGLARHARRERQGQRPRRSHAGHKGHVASEDKSQSDASPGVAGSGSGGTDLSGGIECADGTRHGSFERDLVKLPRTRSHAKSESDLERPHQVSVTADGAGPPVTRAPIGS